MHKKENGITLMVLVVTIIVLLILAGVTLNMVVGNNGILTKTQLASENTRAAGIEEEKELWKSNNQISKFQNNSDYLYDIDRLTNDLLNKKLINESEKEKILDEGKITVGNKEIIFIDTVLHIKTKEDFENFRDEVNNGNNFEDAMIILDNNIDLSCNPTEQSTWWIPIGYRELNATNRNM